VTSVVSRLPAVREWPLWQLPGWLSALVLAVVAADTAAIATAAAVTQVHVADLRLFAVLLGCSLITTRRVRGTGDLSTLMKDMNGVWELPVALLLPPLYGLLAPIPRFVLAQRRHRLTTHRRVYSACSLGLSYAATSLVFHAFTPVLASPALSPQVRGIAWCGCAIACGALQAVTNYALVLTAVTARNPAMSLRAVLFSRESFYVDGAELPVGVMIAYAVSAGPLMALFALPFVPLLQRSLLHSQLAAAARTDSKTGLLNAAAWQAEARLMLGRAARAGEPAALAVIDIDHFKAVNDSRGHLAGDAVLAAVATAMRCLFRDGDICGRVGGDEFAVLFPLTAPHDGLLAAERLCGHIAGTAIGVPGGAGPVRVTLSIGVCPLDARHGDLDSLLAAADTALYAAKESGRNAVRTAG
jgi:diguanylate cyclase (GGDEF)-like protein